MSAKAEVMAHPTGIKTNINGTVACKISKIILGFGNIFIFYVFDFRYFLTCKINVFVIWLCIFRVCGEKNSS